MQLYQAKALASRAAVFVLDRQRGLAYNNAPDIYPHLS
jgi:hypothetical protein